MPARSRLDYRFLGPREFGLNVIETPSSGFSSAAVGCTRQLIAAKRSLVARLVQGYVETIHFFKIRRAEVIPLLQRFLMFKHLRAVEEAYDFYAPPAVAAPIRVRHPEASPGARAQAAGRRQRVCRRCC